mmetsp:Transcript_1096/g.976  ORF Transcript_1096/g.976 Transcript_1096/m.976 type:complete len:187 (-) Transcript_1096:869-1429(-)
MTSIVHTIESVARAVAFLSHFFMIATFLILQAIFKPLLPHIDSICDNYFSRNYKEKGLQEYLCRKFSTGMFQIFGIRILAEYKTDIPEHSEENQLLMFTHSSNLDPPLLTASWPYFSHFIAKKELFKIPIFGSLMKLVGHIPIDRANLKSAIHTLKDTASVAVSEKKTISIAPEGTRRRTLSTGPD